MQTKRNFILLIIIIIMVVSMVGGYFFIGWKPATKPIEEEEATSSPSILFSADDYKIEEKLEGKFIVIEKVGFSAKAPKGWRVEKIESASLPSSQYWLEMFSPDAEMSEKSKAILEKGCGIGVSAGTKDKEEIKEIRDVIDFLQKHPEAKTEEIALGVPIFPFPSAKEDNYKIRELTGCQGVEWISSEESIFGQPTSVEIPIGNNKLISLNTVYPSGYKEKCLPIWNDFLKSIIIK